ncbi:hypothetical protein GJU94_06170 [Brucella sp. 10RB9214]|uniref:NaeI family type II restriction endonuclease n=1 Tax=unclassified Brucella TaxID=2632610 RepID=UPI0009726B32|nr:MULTISPECIES: NaeI family type II restriction endonuclease [unclassified Brucella]APY14771.1 hypothetical protein BKD02_11300 [Brucella sp. 09RB8910]MRN45765.1 hypothetical protein [Brucella sp. 10RB9212]MRN49419.1 hypothetical protein [Brucella sp. 10RB9214]
MAYQPLDSAHPDFKLVSMIVETMLLAAGGLAEFEVQVPLILRNAIDEVIDAPRTRRFLLSETEKTEKTYLGTKVEILIRSYLRAPKGLILDMNIAGVDVDIKNTMQSNWSIPKENVGRPALLIRSSESRAVCDVGVGVLHDAYLRAGENRDTKRGLASAHFNDIWWILRDHPYPVNFWQILTPEQRQKLVDSGRGTKRLAALFTLVQRRPISRSQVHALAQQHDYMKRMRRNGGARDILAAKGIALLSGAYDQEAIKFLGLGTVTREEFISTTPQSIDETIYLRKIGHID